MTDVVLYARLSVTTEESVSIARQLEAGRQYAAARGWTVVGEFADDNVSASKVRPDARKGWRALLAEVEQRRSNGSPIHAALAWKIDRIARRLGDFTSANDALADLGAGLVVVDDSLDMTTDTGRMVAQILAVFAEFEARQIASRVKAARAALLKAGRRGGGRPPYGWRNVPNPAGPGVVLAQDPDRIGYVAEAAQRILSGDSLYSVTRWLDESGAPRRPHKGRKNGDGWAEASVESILRNPVLAGLVPYAPNRKPGEAPDPWAVLRDEDGVMVRDEEAAILTIAERRRLLEALDARLRPGSRPQQGKTPTLLSRLLRCASCGSVMHRSTSGTRNGPRYSGYRCANRACERQASVGQRRIEEYVIERALAERGETRLHEFRTIGTDDEALASIEEALRQAGAELATTDDPETEERLLTRIATLKARRASARLTAVPSIKKIVAPTRGQREWGDEFTDALDAGDTLAAARLLREQVTSITVHPSGQNAHAALADRCDIEWTPLAED